MKTDMTDSEFLRQEAAFQRKLTNDYRSDADIRNRKYPASSRGFKEQADRLESIATKYEQMARAVLWAYDESLDSGWAAPYRVAYANVVTKATGKHPSDWTRDALMKHLGIAQEESKDE